MMEGSAPSSPPILVTDYTSCQLEARSQGAFLLPSPISRPLPLITIMTLDTCHHYWCQPGTAGQLIITHHTLNFLYEM